MFRGGDLIDLEAFRSLGSDVLRESEGKEQGRSEDGDEGVEVYCFWGGNVVDWLIGFSVDF